MYDIDTSISFFKKLGLSLVDAMFRGMTDVFGLAVNNRGVGTSSGQFHNLLDAVQN